MGTYTVDFDQTVVVGSSKKQRIQTASEKWDLTTMGSAELRNRCVCGYRNKTVTVETDWGFVHVFEGYDPGYSDRIVVRRQL